MKTQCLFIICLITVAFSVTSCSKDSPSDLTQSAGKTEINTAIVNYNMENAAIDSAQGLMVYNRLSSLSLPFSPPSQGNLPSASSARSRSFSSENLCLKNENPSSVSVQNAFGFRQGFNIQNYVGTYEWDAQNHQFNHTNTPTDQVIVKFPYPATGSTNNAVYTISKYTVTYDSEADSYKGDYIANITLDGNDIWSVNFSSTFQSTENLYTSHSSLTLKFAPYEYSELSDANSPGTVDAGELSLKASRILKKASRTIVSGAYDVSGKYSGSSLNISASSDLTVMNIYFHYTSSYSGNEVNYNSQDNLRIVVYNTGGAKIGEMKYVPDQDQELILMFYFNNGKSVYAEPLFDSILQEWYYFYDSMENNYGGKKK
ncbi:MAG TPA: hypothetical protein VMV56_04675 [Williamwhitmania sp.]|nr:hypothetical protein [Williamwhitmania sp.]